MKTPFPAAPLTLVLMGCSRGGICQLVVFPSAGMPSAPAPAAQGASPTPSTGWVHPPSSSSAPAVPPASSQMSF